MPGARPGGCLCIDHSMAFNFLGHKKTDLGHPDVKNIAHKSLFKSHAILGQNPIVLDDHVKATA